MTKAVVKIGGKQFIVTEKQTILVDLLPEETKELTLDALLVIDGEKVSVGGSILEQGEYTLRLNAKDGLAAQSLPCTYMRSSYQACHPVSRLASRATGAVSVRRIRSPKASGCQP